MSLSLLLLLVCSSQATHFYGTVMTYYPKNSSTNGSVTVVLRYKLNFGRKGSDSWDCINGNCGTQRALTLSTLKNVNGEGWYQTEGIMTRDVPSRAPFQLELAGGNWIRNIRNAVILWKAVTLVELRSRSDTGKANTSPQTTILPAVRVPSNCQRDFDLLAFDPDGDEVKCRYGSLSHAECDNCTPPSVTNLSQSCTLSFSSNVSSDQGPYAVQLVMEDFPRQTIILSQTNGELTIVTTNDAISKIPIQFVLRVDSGVASCTEGLYLPRFLPPTPGNRARLYAPVNQSLEISISAEANISTVSELLFSGPHNVNQTTAAAAGRPNNNHHNTDDTNYPSIHNNRSNNDNNHHYADGTNYPSIHNNHCVNIANQHYTNNSYNRHSAHNYPTNHNNHHFTNSSNDNHSSIRLVNCNNPHCFNRLSTPHHFT
ncbi:hypothetical protein F2P81_018116 [Scophthalmus maximus]|uniref:Uncharacterized protein n=1 Tax=Scophthalmus maximus TaxID=52904 RepID=A0A6A4SD38_SCOMX|nr:hypothetical protein F2P81_018116 [Scophthalmus maximus]